MAEIIMLIFVLIALAFGAAKTHSSHEKLSVYSLSMKKENVFARNFIKCAMAITEKRQNICPILLKHTKERNMKSPNWVKYTFYYEEYKETDWKEFLSELREMTQTARANYYTEIVRVVQRLEENGIIVDLNLQTLVHLKQYFIDVRVLPEINHFYRIDKLFKHQKHLSQKLKDTLQAIYQQNANSILTNVFGVSSFLTDLEFSVFNESVNFESIQSFRMRKPFNNRFFFAFKGALTPISENEKLAFEAAKGNSNLYELLIDYVIEGGKNGTFTELLQLIENATNPKILKRSPKNRNSAFDNSDESWD